MGKDGDWEWVKKRGLGIWQKRGREQVQKRAMGEMCRRGKGKMCRREGEGEKQKE